jgi:hypothetical protein
MFQLLRKLRHWIAARFTPARPSPDPDAMELHDWADLPPHHPLCP